MKMIKYVIAMFVVLSSVLVSTAYANNTSWYGGKFHGRLTASGERFNQWADTAAHRTLPFGTVVKVTNKKNGKSVTVKITDRGPFHKRRHLDLSRGAAQKIGCPGVCNTKIEVIKKGDGKTYHRKKRKK